MLAEAVVDVRECRELRQRRLQRVFWLAVGDEELGAEACQKGGVADAAAEEAEAHEGDPLAAEEVCVGSHRETIKRHKAFFIGCPKR